MKTIPEWLEYFSIEIKVKNENSNLWDSEFHKIEDLIFKMSGGDISDNNITVYGKQYIITKTECKCWNNPKNSIVLKIYVEIKHA